MLEEVQVGDGFAAFCKRTRVCFGSKPAACCFDLWLYLFLPDRRLQASFRAPQTAWNQSQEPETRERLLLTSAGQTLCQIQCCCSKNPTKEQLLIINPITNIFTVAKYYYWLKKWFYDLINDLPSIQCTKSWWRHP